MANRFRAKLLLAAWGLAVVATHPGTAWADRVVMRDGRVREGKVVSQDAATVVLKIGSEGLSMTVRIPAQDVAEVQITPKDGPATAGAQPAPPPTLGPGVLPPTTNNTLSQRPPAPTTGPATRPAVVRSTKYFFREAFLMAIGQNASKFDREALPPDQGQLWTKGLEADAKGDKVAEAAALTQLINMPGADLRLIQKLCMRQHGVLFGDWLGKLRWENMEGKSHYGQFDLHDVTPIETPALIGYLRAATPQAINYVRSFYPLPPSVLDLPKASRPPDPLATIPVEGATHIKELAFNASALVSAQLKLEPNMPAVDQRFLLQHLGSLRQIISKCAELEPQEWAAAEKKNREAKAAAERAHQEALRQKQLAPPPLR
jgi:hypothetical protein